MTEDGEDAYIPVKSAEDFSDVEQSDWFSGGPRMRSRPDDLGLPDTEFSPESRDVEGNDRHPASASGSGGGKGESSS